MISRGPNTAHGRGTPAELGGLTTALSGMEAGTWLDWTSSTNAGPITDTGPDGLTAWLESAANLPWTNWPGKLTWDASRKQIVGTGTAQGYIGEGTPGAHSAATFLDVTTGVFTKAWNPLSLSLGHVYDCNCSMPLANKIYRLAFNSEVIYQCDLTTRAWTSARNVSTFSLGAIKNIDVFPDLGASGSLLLINDAGKLCRWDISTDALSVIGTYDGIGAYPSIHYVPASAAVVFGGGSTGTKFRKIDSTGAVSVISTSLPSGLTGIGAGVVAPMVADPAGRAKSWVFELDGNVFSLDHATGTWTDYGACPTNMTAPPGAIHGHDAIVFFDGKGRLAGSSLSKVRIFKVI